MSKNIEINISNGNNSYEILYPKTLWSNVLNPPNIPEALTGFETQVIFAKGNGTYTKLKFTQYSGKTGQYLLSSSVMAYDGAWFVGSGIFSNTRKKVASIDVEGSISPHVKFNDVQFTISDNGFTWNFTDEFYVTNLQNYSFCLFYN